MTYIAIFFVAQPPLPQHCLCINPLCTAPRLQPWQSLIIAWSNTLGNENCACPEHLCLSISSVSKILIFMASSNTRSDMVSVCTWSTGFQLTWYIPCSHLQKPEERPALVPSCVTNSCYTGLEEATEIVFMFHELHSSCLLDGHGEAA